MNIRLVLNILGKVLLVEGVALLPALAVALLYGQGDAACLLYGALCAAGAGALLSLLRPRNDNMRAREGFAAVALCWVSLSFFGALPAYLGGYIPSLVDSFFETVSGFTTTGASILRDVEALPRGIMFWRCFTHWIGGMGVLVLTLALIPRMGGRALHLLRAESPGPTPGKLVPRLGNTARILYRLYIVLSVALFAALMLCGLDWYDAAIHTFGTAGTGGFSNYATSVGHFASPAVDAVIGVFMLLFGVNFSMYFFLLQGDFKNVLHDEELRAYVLIVAISVGLIALNIAPRCGSALQALRYSFFQVSTIITTTGFATTDFNLWPQFSRMILVLLMFIGSCAGSTGGGIKVIRAVLLCKGIRREVRRAMRPRSVVVVKLDGRAVDEQVLSQVQMFFFAYLLLIVLGTLAVSLDGFDFETNLTACISAISNIGPGLGMVGPMGSFADYSAGSKLVFSFLMLVGRLEIYPMLMLFSRSIWKKN